MTFGTNVRRTDNGGEIPQSRPKQYSEQHVYLHRSFEEIEPSHNNGEHDGDGFVNFEHILPNKIQLSGNSSTILKSNYKNKYPNAGLVSDKLIKQH